MGNESGTFKVSDDWYPNYPGNVVRYSLQEVKPLYDIFWREKRWKIVIEGEDDFGMEKFYDSWEDAQYDLKYLKNKKSIDQPLLGGILFREW